MPDSVLRRAKQVADPTATSSHEDDITCVICMNYIHYWVNEHGSLVRVGGDPDDPDDPAARQN